MLDVDLPKAPKLAAQLSVARRGLLVQTRIFSGRGTLSERPGRPIKRQNARHDVVLVELGEGGCPGGVAATTAGIPRP